MTVLRIVPNIATNSVDDVRAFYLEMFDLDVAMDFGWITTLTSGETAQTQISIANQGGGGADVPDLSIEVDDVDALYVRSKQLGLKIEYDLKDEPWGVRRFFLCDPTGKLLNILSHIR